MNSDKKDSKMWMVQVLLGTIVLLAKGQPAENSLRTTIVSGSNSKYFWPLVQLLESVKR
jgi:hypothetical protein